MRLFSDIKNEDRVKVPTVKTLGKNECRMSNKEFRMTKFDDLDFQLRRSLFLVRPARYALKQISDRSAMPMSVTATVALQSTSQGRRVFCGLPASGGFAFERLHI